MPASAAFLTAWRSHYRRPVVLAQVSLTGRTIRLASKTTRLPDGTLWEGMLTEVEPIHAQASLLGSGPFYVGASFKIEGPRMAWQTGAGAKLGHVLSNFVWEGSKVVIMLWDESLTSASDAFGIYNGTVNRVEAGVDSIKVHCIQSRRWNKRVPTRSINALDYPNAPDGSSAALPIIYGNFSARDLRSPWQAGSVYKRDFNDMGLARGVVPGYVVDKGGQSGIVKVLFASHPLKVVSGIDSADGGTYDLNPVWISGANNGLLGNVIWDVAKFAKVSSATEGGFTFANDGLLARTGVLPVDVRNAGTTGTSPRNALDYTDETNSAGLVTGQAIKLIVPGNGGGGEITKAELFVAHSGGGVTVFYNSASVVATSSQPPKITRGTFFDNSGGASRQWDFGQGVSFDVTVQNSTGSSIYLAGIIVTYRPQYDFLSPPTVVQVATATYDAQGRRITGDSRTTERSLGGFSRFVPRNLPDGVIAFSTPFFGNVQGYKDTGTTYAGGSSGALIERAPDIAGHLLDVYGGVPLAGTDVDGISQSRGATTFGSLVQARAAMGDWIMSVHIGSFTDLSSVLSDLAAQSASMFYIDRFDNAIQWVHWADTTNATYSRNVFKDDLLAISAELASDTTLTNAVRVQYWHDYNTGKDLLETFVNKDGSSSGYQLADVRDQRQVIGASNNTLVWKYVGGSNFTETLTQGAYTPIDLANEMRNKMRIRVSGDANIHVGWGFDIKSGYNDVLDITIGGSLRAVTLTPGRYTGPSLAAHVQSVLSAFNSSVAVTYGFTSGAWAFTITTTSGTFSRHATTAAANASRSAWPVLGMFTDALTTTIVQSTRSVVADRFWFVKMTSSLYTASMVLVVAGSTVFKTIGFGITSDATFTGINGDKARGDREVQATTNTALYGDRGEVVVQAPYIRDEDVATRLRNIIFDYQSTPRVKVTFATERMVDLKRGQVINFDSTVNNLLAFPKPGTNGSWASRDFRVVEVVQHVGPTSFHQEVVAVEV